MGYFWKTARFCWSGRTNILSSSWVIPGGHVEYGVKIKELFGVYSDPKRDPRYHTASVVYLLEKGKGKIRLSKETSEFRYFSLNNLPKKIGFDHRKILNDLKKKYRN